MLKQICVCAVALSLVACSEDMLTPKYDQESSTTMPDAKTLKKHPFLMATGDWKANTGDITLTIDDLGHFIMRDSNMASSVEGYLVSIGTSDHQRFELYKNDKTSMNLTVSVEGVDKERQLILLNNTTTLKFRLTNK